jgi:hypothetical protein
VSRLSAVLEAGRFVATAEIAPPCGCGSAEPIA